MRTRKDSLQTRDPSVELIIITGRNFAEDTLSNKEPLSAHLIRVQHVFTLILIAVYDTLVTRRNSGAYR
jgi:hypothetical protein